jgi:hypothetical protein
LALARHRVGAAQQAVEDLVVAGRPFTGVADFGRQRIDVGDCVCNDADVVAIARETTAASPSKAPTVAVSRSSRVKASVIALPFALNGSIALSMRSSRAFR